MNPHDNTSKSLTEARVLELIRQSVRRQLAASFSSNLANILATDVPLFINNPGASNASLALALDAAFFDVVGGELTFIGSAAAPTQVYGETPSGTINGINDEFTLANAPTAGTLRVFLNGLRMREGSGNDFTVTGTTLTMLQIPETDDDLQVDYLY